MFGFKIAFPNFTCFVLRFGRNSCAGRQARGGTIAEQLARQGKSNRELSGREVDEGCRADAAGEALLRESGDRFSWSARAYYRVLKVARAIADLAGTDVPMGSQIAEAVQYRRAFAVG